MPATNQPKLEDKRPWVSNEISTSFAILFGELGILLYSLQYFGRTSLTVFSVGSLAAGAALSVGALLGFVFGIPRTVGQRASKYPDDPRPLPRPAQPTGSQSSDSTLSLAAGRDQGRAPDYAPNTNLEELSDWLTKILVGVGLTQIGTISSHLWTMSGTLAPGLGGAESARPFAIAIVIYFCVCGLMSSYIITSLRFRSALERNARRLESLAARVVEYKEQSDRDALAFALALRQLNRSAAPADPARLRTSIRDASPRSRSEIFHRARDVRREGLKDPHYRTVIDRTIPIWESLIDSDSECIYYQNHAQLAYALKDGFKCDYCAAERELTRAIEIRDQQRVKGWEIYEFNRAICRILQDVSFASGKPTEETIKAAILSDLRVAMCNNDLRTIATGEHRTAVWQRVEEWMVLNQVVKTDLVRPLAAAA